MGFRVYKMYKGLWSFGIGSSIEGYYISFAKWMFCIDVR